MIARHEIMTCNDGIERDVIMIGRFSDKLFEEISEDYMLCDYEDLRDDGWKWSREIHGQFGSWETVTLDGIFYCVKIPDELLDTFEYEIDNEVIEAVINSYRRELEND